jgi:plastocyanin
LLIPGAFAWQNTPNHFCTEKKKSHRFGYKKHRTKCKVVFRKSSELKTVKPGGFKTKNYNKTIIFALLMVTILFMSTNLAGAKESKLVVKSADTSSNKIVIYGTFAPETIEINAGEEVTWFNFKKPKTPMVLVSEDELWEDTILYYGKAFSYTFEKPGTYVFTLKDNPEIKGTVTVNAASEPQEKDSETPVETRAVEKNKATTETSSSLNSGASDEENVQNEEKMLIYSTTFSPETIEIEKGDTLTWVNLKRPKGPSVLVSDDGLWEDTTLYYGKAFSYTFEKAGTYTFSLEGMPEVKATVTVT